MAQSHKRHSRLVQISVPSVTQGPAFFGERQKDGSVPIVLIPAKRSPASMWMQVPSGVYCLWQRAGKDMGIAPPGLHRKYSWWRVAYIVTQQSCTYDAPVQRCPTADNVMVNVDLTLVFRILDPGAFVYKLGASRFDELLSAAAEEAIRGLVRSQTHDKIYSLRQSAKEDMLVMLKNKFQEFGVSFDDAKIADVQLPSEVQTSLERTTILTRKIDVENKDFEFEATKVQHTLDLKVQEGTVTNERAVAKARAHIKRLEVEKARALLKVEEEKELAIIKARESAGIMTYNADMRLRRDKLDAQKDAAQRITTVEGQCAAARTKASEMEKVAEVEAKARLEVAKAAAQGMLHQAEAQQAAAEKLKTKREHELAVARIQAKARVARKGKMIVSADQGDSVIRSVVGDSLSQLD